MRMQTTFVWEIQLISNGGAYTEHVIARTAIQAIDLVTRVTQGAKPEERPVVVSGVTRGPECWYDADDM